MLLGPVVACGGQPKPPSRAVYERDVGDWSFRRYQALLDVEVWVPKNKAAAHSASYVHVDGLKRGQLGTTDVVNVVVTRYKRSKGIDRALVKFVRRLGSESRYQIDEKKIAGVRVLTADSPSESWVIWASKKHVIKVGGRGRDSIPESIVEEYGKPYPSTIKGGALEGRLPEGPDAEPETEDVEPFDPDNPRPKWQE